MQFHFHANQCHFHKKGFALKALVNEDTLLPMMFLGLRKLGNICCRHNVSEQNQKHSLCPGHKICGQTGKHFCRQQCVRNNVSLFARAFRLGLKQRQKGTWKWHSTCTCLHVSLLFSCFHCVDMKKCPHLWLLADCPLACPCKAMLRSKTPWSKVCCKIITTNKVRV